MSRKLIKAISKLSERGCLKKRLLLNLKWSRQEEMEAEGEQRWPGEGRGRTLKGRGWGQEQLKMQAELSCGGIYWSLDRGRFENGQKGDVSPQLTMLTLKYTRKGFR